MDTASRAALAVLARVLLVVLGSLLGIACLTPVVIAEPLAPTSNDSHVTTYDYLVASRQGDNGTAPWRGPSRGAMAESSVEAVFEAQAGVAAKTATHSVPIGPGSEKAWTVLNRVDAKGAPLPGYKGGSVFKNTDGKLPETPGVTYREWDVNPYTKGVNRGSERIVTGSDGSAYWTGDHYDSFLMFRGPTG